MSNEITNQPYELYLPSSDEEMNKSFLIQIECPVIFEVFGNETDEKEEAESYLLETLFDKDFPLITKDDIKIKTIKELKQI